MIKDQNQTQSAGDGSTNLQGQSIVIHQGISYSDAKQIAHDVYKANFMQLASDAVETARSRVDEITEEFLSRLSNEKEESLGSMRDPGMQSALYEAQKQYAKTGDKDLEGLLVDILVQRAQIPERNLRQIVLDEALVVAGKLTAEQLDALTVNFILSKTRNSTLVNLEGIARYFDRDVIPFLGTLTNSDSCYEHLQYTGCGSLLEITHMHPIEKIFLHNYPGLFSKGFTKEEFEEKVGSITRFSQLIMQSFHYPDKYQINAMSEIVIESSAKQLALSADETQKILTLFKDTLMSESNIREYLHTLRPEMNTLFELWKNSSLSKFSLTPVGIAVAHANFRRRTGQKLDLSKWVK